MVVPCEHCLVVTSLFSEKISNFSFDWFIYHIVCVFTCIGLLHSLGYYTWDLNLLILVLFKVNLHGL